MTHLIFGGLCVLLLLTIWAWLTLGDLLLDKNVSFPTFICTMIGSAGLFIAVWSTILGVTS